MMPDEQRRAEGPARITRSRLDPHILEGSFVQDPSISDAVQRYPTSHDEIPHACELVHMSSSTQNHLFTHGLDRRS